MIRFRQHKAFCLKNSGLIVPVLIFIAFALTCFATWFISAWWLTRKAHLNLLEFISEVPKGIEYVEPNNFGFPDNIGLCMGGWYFNYSRDIIVKYPATNTKEILYAAAGCEYTQYAIPSEDGRVDCYVAALSKHDNDVVIMTRKGEGFRQAYKGYRICTCSYSPDKRKLAFASARNFSQRGGENRWLTVLDLASGEVRFSPKAGFNETDSPPIWLSHHELVGACADRGIILYDIESNAMETIFAGDYASPVRWKGLIIFRDANNVLYQGTIADRSIVRLCQNNLLWGPLTLSLDEKYLACTARYAPDLHAYCAKWGELPPPVSLFVLNLDAKTYTYYTQDIQDGYDSNLTWYLKIK